MRRMTLLAALLCMLMGYALAEPLAFGGRGEDALYEAIAAKDGFFAVGKTTSTDGDLDVRTRSGETGWALLADASGERIWSFCSGKSGMVRMTAPHAYTDGRFSLVLTDETRQRGEWIVLTDRGRQESRAVIPACSALCPQGEEGKIHGMQSIYCSTGPCLLLLLSHEASGELCCTALFPDGGIRSCGAFYGDEQGLLIPLESGGAIHIGAELGAVAVTHLMPGMPPDTQILSLGETDIGVARVTGALADGDGSLLIGLQTVSASQQSGARLIRISAGGEILFDRQLRAGVATMLTETDVGYAALLGDEDVVFFDEDGVQQGQAALPVGTLALLPAGEGVYALTHDPQQGRRQAVFIRIMPREESTLLFAGETAQPVVVTPSPEPRGNTVVPLEEDHLVCRSIPGGVSVTRVNAQGENVWQTRIPIHTAADRLVFESAQTGTDGTILLYGHYETDLTDGVFRESAQVRLSRGGVLQGIDVYRQ